MAAVTLLWGVGLAANVAHAVDKHWNVGTGVWGISTNWSPQGLPGANDIVYVGFFSGGPGTAVVSTEVGSPISVSVFNDNVIRINNQGSLGAQGDFIVGRDNTHGTLNVINPNPIVAYSGRVTVGNTMRVGMFSGVGTVSQNDGVVNVNQLVRVGDRNQPGSMFTASGVYNLSGIGVLNAARLEVGYGGDSGQFPNMHGTFNLSGNAVLNVSLNAQIPDPHIGGGGATGVLNQTGGSFNSPFRVVVVGQGSGSGVYNYSGGSVNIGGLFIPPNGTVNYLAGASFTVGQLQMRGGRVSLSAGGDKVLRTPVLWSVGSSSTIDLNDNAMVALSVSTGLGGETLHSLLFRGFNNGSWNGNGIRSSAAAAAPHLTRALGFGQAGELGFSTFGGEPIPSSAWIVRYTRMGDANLDGVVNLQDFNRLANNFGGANKEWWQADFNYDGVVSLHDFNLLAANFGLAASGPDVTPQDWADLAAAIPEPMTIAVVTVLAACALRPRRRHGFSNSFVGGV